MDDATTYQLDRLALPEDQAAEFAVRVQWNAGTAEDLAAALAAPIGKAATAVLAYANHGRWVVECPDCRGAQLAARDDRRFMCCDCGNVAVSGTWRPVTWPDEQMVAQVEELLEERPDKSTQSWVPGETVEQLQVENEILVREADA